MLCAKCKKNQATKTYELIKNGMRQTVYYCLECYHNDFVCVETETTLSACPYCGTTVAQFKKTSLVGCANCYEALAHAVFPVVTKMQGGEKHRGKQAYSTAEERIERRCNELDIMANKHYLANDDKGAAVYEEKIDELRAQKGGEPIWHSRPLSKQS
ncbi:MAG: hypothetical protein E7355_01225 [Clostridiales bacterium]|nr:hypothetical protein [Clostridiales bacterium]